MSNNTNTPPPWSEAPPWAMWRAQDADGEWWWYKNKPRQGFAADWWVEGKYEDELIACKTLPNPNWKTTLKKRPENE